MIFSAPASTAPWMTLSPTPPAPNTATDAPGSTFAVLMTAPTPVITPQPTRQALSSGASLRIFTHPVSGMTVSSAKDPTQCGMSMPEPFTLKRGAPSYVPPIIIVCSATSQWTGRPRPHSRQWPQGFIQQRTT